MLRRKLQQGREKGIQVEWSGVFANDLMSRDLQEEVMGSNNVSMQPVAGVRSCGGSAGGRSDWVGWDA